MVVFLVILYELFYFFVFFGLVLSQGTTILSLFPEISLASRILLLCVLFNGFLVPYYLSLMRVKLTARRCVAGYSIIISILFLAYIAGSHSYYSKHITNKKFHPFLQVPPRIQNVTMPKPLGLYRIICLGGSTTEGQNAYSYPRELEKLLQTKFPQKNIEVINGGRFFYSTQHSIIQYLFYLKDLEPDLIIFFHSFNDIVYSFTMPLMASSPFKTDYGHFYGALRNLRYPVLFEDFLSRFFFADIVHPAPQPTPFSDFKSLPIFRRNIETMIKIARMEGVDLILSNQAHRLSEENDSPRNLLGLTHPLLVDESHYADERSWYEAMELFNKTTSETAARFGVPMVDQAAFFKGKHDLFTDCVHMTSEGTAKKAELFFEKIVALGFLGES